MQRALREVWREISDDIAGLSEHERQEEVEDAKAVAKPEFVDSVGAIKIVTESVAFDLGFVRDSLCSLSLKLITLFYDLYFCSQSICVCYSCGSRHLVHKSKV